MALGGERSSLTCVCSAVVSFKGTQGRASNDSAHAVGG